MADEIEFYDVKFRKKVMIPKTACEVESFTTSRGQRTRIIGLVKEGEAVRKLSKLCSKDFTL